MTAADPAPPRPASPSTLRVAAVIIGFGLRQWLNRYAVRATRQKPQAGTRTATPRKRRAGGILAAVATVAGILVYVAQAILVLHNIADAAQRADPDLVIVGNRTWMRLAAIHERAVEDWEGRASYGAWSSDLFDVLDDLVARQQPASDEAESARRVEQLMVLFQNRGMAAFREASSGAWHGAADSFAMLGPLGLVALTIAASIALTGLAGTNLAKDSLFEWWFTFPVPARGLLLARALGMAVSPFVWIMATPFFSVVLWSAGYGWAGIPLAVAATLYIGLIAGSLRIAVETTLPRLLSPRNVERLRAVLAILPLILMFALLAAASPYASQRIIALAQHLPSWLLINPLAPIALAAGGTVAWTAALACTLFTVAALGGSMTLGGWMLRDGLSPSGDERAPRRRAAKRGWTAALEPIAQRELTLLLRDRMRFASVFVFPAVVVAAQLLMAPPAVPGSDVAVGVAIALAFAASVIVLANGASIALARDAPALWIAYTVPLAIERILFRQAMFWSCIAALFALVVFAVISRADPAMFAAGAPRLAVLVVGVTLNGFIATALGALGTDPLEPSPARRMRRASLRLFMLVAAMFGYALYGASAWAIFAQLVLSILLAYALWQKLRDHAPLLLDPSEVPAPSLAVTDGLIAALAFMVLQGVLATALGSEIGLELADLSPGARLVFTFVGAGTIVAGVTLLVFARSRLPDLRATLGLRLPRQGLVRGVLGGIAGGIAGGLVAVAYLALVARVAFLQRLHDKTVSLSLDDAALAPWLAGLAILAAPLFEELIFRAVLYGGFRRSLDPVRAALFSAALFAIVHPPIAGAPVFVLGVIAAAGYERSRSLVVPIVTHMVYNAITLGLAWWNLV